LHACRSTLEDPLLAVGYPAEIPQRPKKKELSEVLKWQTF
jgi:hypothetical protein